MSKLENAKTSFERETYKRIICEGKRSDLIIEFNNNAAAVEALGKYQKAKKTDRIASLIVFAGSLVVFIAGITLNLNKSFIADILFMASLLVGVLWCFRWAKRKKKIFAELKDTLERSINADALWKEYFESKYSNVEFLGRKPFDFQTLLKSYQPKAVPFNAYVARDFGGYAFKLNNHIVETRRVEWKWDNKTFKNKKGKENIYPAIHLCSNDLNEKWNGFKYCMSANTFLNQKNELENETFNNLFSYTHNDPIKLRVLLTPLTQEVCSQDFAKTYAPVSLDFDINNGRYVLTKSCENKTPFTVDLKSCLTVEKIIDELIKDLESDMLFVEECLGMLATFKELTK